jgi:hypothetical protein
MRAVRVASRSWLVRASARSPALRTPSTLRVPPVRHFARRARLETFISEAQVRRSAAYTGRGGAARRGAARWRPVWRSVSVCGAKRHSPQANEMHRRESLMEIDPAQYAVSSACSSRAVAALTLRPCARVRACVRAQWEEFPWADVEQLRPKDAVRTRLLHRAHFGRDRPRPLAGPAEVRGVGLPRRHLARALHGSAQAAARAHARHGPRHDAPSQGASLRSLRRRPLAPPPSCLRAACSLRACVLGAAAAAQVWEKAPEFAFSVLVRSSTQRAFCAGGDVVCALHRACRVG